MKRLYAALVFGAVFLSAACAQAQIVHFVGPNGVDPVPASAANPLPVAATASISGFTPTAAAIANLSATTTSADVALPAGADIVVTNAGSIDAAFRIQVGAGTALTTDQTIKAGAAIGIHVGTATHLSAITASGSTTLNIQGGTGLAAGYGGGGGTTFNGAVTVADGADTTLGAKADAASCATSNTGMACLRQIDADIKGTGNVQGVSASGASYSENPLPDGCRAATAAPTAVTDGQKVAALCGTEGKQVILPYSIKELAVRGTVTSTDTAAHTIIAAGGASIKTYVTGIQCGRTDAGSTALTLTFNDSATSVFVLPAGGATNISLPTPLVTAANTAFQVTSGTGVSTLYCSAQGYSGP